MRQLFTQTMAGECGAGGGDAVRTLQSLPNAHIGNLEPGLLSSQSSQSSPSLSEENTQVSNEKKDSGGGEVAPRKD
jgi:hypothetical protein